MTIPQLSERTVRIIVLSFSLIGLLVLSIIASLTEFDMIHLWESEEHIGERVKVSGTVVGTSPSTSNSAWLLLFEENSTIEVHIERGSGDIRPGSIMTGEGEIISINGDPILSVQNEDHLDIIGGDSPRTIENGIITGEMYFLMGLVRSSRYIGWDEQELIVYPIQDDMDAPTFIIRLMRFPEKLRSGDMINITALFTDEKKAMAYGERSLTLLSRAEPRTISLLRLVEEMSNDPGFGLNDPITIDGYLRYPPYGKSIYISELVEGGEISIKVNLPEPLVGVEKGDLVRLYNCSMLWNAEGLKFEIHPESGMIIERYGPWKLNLEMLEGGLIEFEGCLVEISGTIISEGIYHLLIDGERSIELRNWTGTVDQHDLLVIGRVLFDEMKNSLYIEAEVDPA
jgi:hypothetical protein